jgi:hypothetical protein
VASSDLRRDQSSVSGEESSRFVDGDCGNCGAPMVGPYCSLCGEKKFTRHDYTLGHLAEETLDVFTHFDSRFLRTLKVLLTKPGELSKAYFHGGRSRYTKPLTLFVILNLFFFAIQPHTGLLSYRYADYMNFPRYAALVRNHLAVTGEPPQSYVARFNTNQQNQKKSLLLVSVPVLAVVMAVLFLGTPRTYAEHLVFLIQVYAFLLIFLVALSGLTFLLPRLIGSAPHQVNQFFRSETVIIVPMIAALTIYIYSGLRRAYDASRLRAALTAFVLACAVGPLTGLFLNLLFFVTFWTT